MSVPNGDEIVTSCEKYEYDEDTLRRFEVVKRLQEKRLAEKDQRLEAMAIAKGFPSWKEYKDYQMERWGERDREYARRLEEECKLLGKTVEQYWAEHPQRDRSPPPPPPPCDCDGK